MAEQIETRWLVGTEDEPWTTDEVKAVLEEEMAVVERID